MTPETLEHTLSDLRNCEFRNLETPPDIGRLMLASYRRRQRRLVMVSTAAVAVVVAAIISVSVTLAGGSGHSGTQPRRTSSATPTPSHGQSIGRHGNHLVYALPNTSIPLKPTGTTVWLSPRIPTADGMPGGGVIRYNFVPSSAALAPRSRLLVTPRWTRLKIVFRQIGGDHTATNAIIRKTSYTLLPHQGEVRGRLLAVGGPVATAPRPLSGVVKLRFHHKTSATVTVGPSGRYRATLPDGPYRVVGYSPDFTANGRPVRCDATHGVIVTTHHVVHADAFCQAN